MAVQRERPYTRFNFLVDLGDGDPGGLTAGFQEVSGLASRVDVIEYRNGNARENAPIKLAGLERTSDVVLRRGLIGALQLYQWFDEVRNGNQGAVRNVRIQLQNEDHTEVVATWILRRARIVRYACGPLDGNGSDVVIEEIVLAHERLEME